MPGTSAKSRIAVACGGTGGHVFPGLAVAEALGRRGCDVLVMISPKEVDRRAVQPVRSVAVATLPAVGLTRGNVIRFLAGFARSYALSRRLFRQQPPQAVLAMGGFTSAPPVLAGRSVGAVGFLHESNSIPGRANRWLARFVGQAFVGFPQAAARLHAREVIPTGTPVRPEFLRVDTARCRAALGLAADRPVLLVTGGSQGAAALNQLLLDAAPLLTRGCPGLQLLHLTGAADEARVKAAYAQAGLAAVVHAFLPGMADALGAATAAVSRAGASSLAELAAVRLPALLVPYPAAADDHQQGNARAYADTGAAVMRMQAELTGRNLAELVLGLLRDDVRRQAMREALARWDSPGAADQIAERMLGRLRSAGRLPELDGAKPSERTPVPRNRESALA